MDIRNIDDKYFKEAIKPQLAASLMKLYCLKKLKDNHLKT